MATKAVKEREKKREVLHAKYRKKIDGLKHVIATGSPEEVWQARMALQRIPRNAHRIRQRKRCMVTGRARGVVSDFMLSRIKFREWAQRGYVPGLVKSSW